MLEPALDPREVRELSALQHFRIAGGECRATGVHLVDRGRVFVEERHEYGVGAARVGERLQPRC